MAVNTKPVDVEEEIEVVLTIRVEGVHRPTVVMHAYHDSEPHDDDEAPQVTVVDAHEPGDKTTARCPKWVLDAIDDALCAGKADAWAAEVVEKNTGPERDED